MNKSITTIKSILLAIITVAALVGLADWIPILQHIHDSVDDVYDLVIKIIEILVFTWGLRPQLVKHTAGGILKNRYDKAPQVLSSGGSEEDFYSFAKYSKG